MEQQQAQQAAVSVMQCPSCQRAHEGLGRFCNWCGQYMIGRNGIKRADLMKRLVGDIFDTLLWYIMPLIGLIIGWVAGGFGVGVFLGFVFFLAVGSWFFIAFGKSQSPGKQIMSTWVIEENGEPATRGEMIVRDFLAKVLLFHVLSVLTLGLAWILDYLWPIWDKDKQALHDKVSTTFVIEGPRQ